LDFLKLGRSRLGPEGVFCQWLHTYDMAPDDLKSLLATFAEVFPRVLVYQEPGVADLFLIGSRGELNPFSRDLSAWLNPARVADLQRIDAEGPYDLLAYLSLDRPAILELAGDVGLNTDDNMRIEFSAPLYLHASTTRSNQEMLEAHAKPGWELQGQGLATGTEASDLLAYGDAFARQGRLGDAELAFEKAEELQPGHPHALQRLREVRELR
jgi:hypothetical protein